MIEKIIRYSVKNKLIIGALMIAHIIWGLTSLSKLSVDAVPDITNNQVQILTTTRNLSTLDVEQFISYPIEMEMANLPGVKEIRSTNKFGLSVVTIVFEDEMGTYLPRQLIAEKIKMAKENIPEGFGDPEMGPITTGLGEIYQYVVDIKPGYEDKYTDMDLRTIQDWIVKRQLSGIDGVVEVNTWGGHLKQYEIAVEPMLLKSMNISIDEIVDAVESNNGITGAGYIEKNSQSYFIRAEGLIHDMDGIKKIVVKVVNNRAILIEDIAQVKLGHAPRFGAITANGQGEKVMGQVMLLKGANTKKVLEDVIERVAAIQPTLPEGVYINPFLERSELLGKTTFTIYENLLLGGLIVIFIVILLLGNFRSGIIIASLIPLSLLFAIGMMNVFGVSANLMSLGAIDFGIIIDGAIIIVEFVLYSLTVNSATMKGLTGQALRDEKDNIVIDNSSTMMRSAIFGQIIILIVFLPILTLQGVEGKMFKPMAMTFSFALIGAMILCLTYVPMMASLLMKPSTKTNTFSHKVNKLLQRVYGYFIHPIFKLKKSIVLLSIVIFSASIFIFTKLGGEFVPTLDEGDIVIQPLIASGTSLGKTIEICTMMESLLKEKFTEIDQIVSRIGAAEVPTDPMAMEEVDMIITLNDKSTWKRASTKDGLIDEMTEELHQIPGMEYEFTQPIEMRFNELISGSRADISVKIYGEDIDILFSKATDAKYLMDNISGAADVVIDKVENIPQVKISYNRAKIAQYGLSIKDVNHSIQMAYSGISLGQLYQGEKRFDIVMRYEEANRSKIENIEHTMISLDNGNQIPLGTIADVKIVEAPSKIARDDTKRRVSVGVNVRNRDLESVVIDIKNALSKHLNLPPGYHVKYGGQFENLNSARNRLLLVVPIALLLIFLLLYMTFHSIAEAALIYTAIPFASIGGILLLWLRGMPFSISSGIGFIALFGIAVLNGIVLIEHFKHMKLSNFKSINDMIIEGTKQRIRPVLLTASAAALGFLPMAISTSSGAEVQRPLATAVIGGLISSTILTLIILPILYSWLMKYKEKRKHTPSIKALVILPFLLLSLGASSQELNSLSLEETIQLAIENSPTLEGRKLDYNKNHDLENLSYQPGSTSFTYTGDGLVQDNPNQVHEFSISQEFDLPKIQKTKNKLQQELSIYSNIELVMAEVQLRYDVTSTYISLQKMKQLYLVYDSLEIEYNDYYNIASKRAEKGSENELGALQIQSALVDLQLEKTTLSRYITNAETILKIYTNHSNKVTSKDVLVINESTLVDNPNYFALAKADQIANIKKSQIDLNKTRSLPKLSLGLGIQNYFQAGWYGGVELGVDLPIFKGNIKKINQANQVEYEIARKQVDATIKQIDRQKSILINDINLQKEIIDILQKRLKEQIPEMTRITFLNYKVGDVSYLELLQIINLKKKYSEQYWEAVAKYNTLIAKYEMLAL